MASNTDRVREEAGRGWPKREDCNQCGGPMTGKLFKNCGPRKWTWYVEWTHDEQNYGGGKS